MSILIHSFFYDQRFRGLYNVRELMHGTIHCMSSLPRGTVSGGRAKHDIVGSPAHQSIQIAITELDGKKVYD